MRFLAPLAIALALLVPTPLALATAQNDAGLGTDAPGDSSLAVDLAPGSYTAQMLYNEGDVGDWYRVVIPAGTSFRLTYRATSGGLYGGLYTDGSALIQNGFSSGNTVTFTAAGGAYRLGFGNNAGVGTAAYTFNVESIAQNDAGLGTDAPGDSWLAVDLAPGSYTGQMLYNVGDKGDWYRVVVPTGNLFRLTYRATSGSLYGGLYTDGSALVQNGFSNGNTVTFTVAGGAYRLGFGNNAGVGTAAYTFNAESIGQNDAGLGGDAPGASSQAAPLGVGTYDAQLFYLTGDMEDWFRYAREPCGGIVLTARATSGSLYVGVYDDAGVPITNRLTTGNTVTLSVATNGPFRLGFGNSAGTGTASYTFTISPGIRQNDAGSGCDAADGAASARDIVAGGHAGTLHYSLFDKADWYRLDVPDCTVILVTVDVTSGSLYAGLYTDDGTPMGPYGNARSTGSTIAFLATGGPFKIALGDSAGTGLATYTLGVEIVRQGDPVQCMAASRDVAVGASLIVI